jgi:hypothetical protein
MTYAHLQTHAPPADQSTLPNVFILGAAKSGTTSLAAALGRHGQIFMCRPKEPRYFGSQWDKGLDWYRTLFEAGKEKKFRVDASTMYLSSGGHYLDTPQRIAGTIQAPRFIVVARHPLERIVSHWRHWKGRYPKTVDFNRFMDHPPLRNLLLGCSLYTERLEPYRRLFGEKSIHCLTFEDLVNDPVREVRAILKFLGANSNPEVMGRLLPEGQLPVRNVAGDNGRVLVPKPDWDVSVRDRALEVIRPDSRAFLARIGKPASYWVGV